MVVIGLMLASGIKKLWPEDYDKLPEKYSFQDVCSILRKHLSDWECGG